MAQGAFCTRCGAALPTGAQFCDKCGQAVGSSPAAPGISEPDLAQPKRRFPWLALILGAGCFGALCLAAVVAGALAFFSDLNIVLPAFPAQTISATPPPPTPLPVLTAPVQPSVPTDLPTPTLLSFPTIGPATPTGSGPALTGDQRLDVHSLYDDFSSQALGWPVFDGGKTILQYEDQAYSFQIAEPDYFDWAYFPVDFIPYEIWFDVQGLAGAQEGTFGVFCQFQDEDNYYYVEFDLETNAYLAGQSVDGEDLPLTPKDSSGQYWQSTSALKSAPTSANRIGVSCYLDTITLFINDQWVDEVRVGQPFDKPGGAAFFVYAFESAGEDGYKVIFDNVEVWQPVQ